MNPKRTGVALFAAALGLGGFAVAQTVHPRSGGIDVIAHRGASAHAPENTLAAFKLAAEMGADWFELDCRLSGDGTVVVIHDATVDRTTNGTGAVADMTVSQLKALDAGAWKDPKFAGERVPTLGEALDFASDRIGVYVEIKDCADDAALKETVWGALGGSPLTPQGEKTLMEIIEQSGTRNLPLTREAIREIRERRMAKDVVIQSFSPIVCAIALAEAPEIRTELLVHDNGASPGQWKKALQWGEFLQVPGLNPNVRATKVRADRLEALQRQGRTISVWTVNGSRDMTRLARWGANAIITNWPDVCLEVLQKEGKR